MKSTALGAKNEVSDCMIIVSRSNRKKLYKKYFCKLARIQFRMQCNKVKRFILGGFGC